MATLKPTLHISTVRVRSMIPRAISPNYSHKLKQLRRTFSVRCAVFQQDKLQSRRSISIALLFLQALSLPKDALAGGFDKYMKRKKLDPLETYIPAVILAELQIKDLGKFLEVKQPRYADCRSLLRSGPAGSLRVNIRAVAQYASDDSNNKSAFNNVDECLRSLEELDSLLLHASRNERDASTKSMMVEVNAAVAALDGLLQTVPPEVLQKGKTIADAYRTPDDDFNTPGNLDPELEKLESIL